MTEEEDKAIKDCDSIFICLDDAMSKESANDYRKSYKILKNLIEKQFKEIEQTKYIKRNFDYCIAVEKKKLEDKIKAKIQECREILYSFEKEIELKPNKEKYIHKESINCLLSQISILQSLLEKE